MTNVAGPKAAGLFGPPASGYSGRYGFGSTAAPSSVSEQERQWYIDNKFGDPYEVDKQSKMIHPWMPPATSSNYKGVSNEARYLYQQSSVPKTVYLQERYGITGCVGCGRCTAACTAEIASIAEMVGDIVGKGK